MEQSPPDVGPVPFASITEVIVVSVDENLRIKSFTPNINVFFDATGLGPGANLTQVRTRFAYPELASDVFNVVEQGHSVQRLLDFPDADVSFLISIQPDIDVPYKQAGAVLSVMNVSGRTAIDAKLAAVEARCTALTTKASRTLAREVQMRVRKMLSVTRLIMRHTATSSQSLDDFNDHFYGRIDAISRVQTMGSRNAEGLIDLNELIEEELFAQTILNADTRITIEGPALFLRQQKSELFALAIHELTMNALKFGSLSIDTGTLRVVWNVTQQASGQSLTLEWGEDGINIETQPEAHGFGMDVLQQRLKQSISATSDCFWRKNGLICRINIPLIDDYFILGE